MTFAYPKILLLLLLFPPLLAVFFWWSLRKRQELMTKFIQARLLPNLTVGISPVRQKIQMACVMGAVVCLVVALARPQWGFDYEEVKQRGLDIVVAIDTSKSMLARDVAPNRLTRAKLAALDLMQQAKSDRLGLVAFAGSAFLQCPLTIDDSAFRRSVEDLSVNTIPQGGTALAEAINTALTAFKEGDNYKVLVLMTDGEDNDQGVEAAIKKATEAGMRIYTIGIGTPEGEIVSIADGQGHSDYVRDEQGNVVKSHLNESLLRQISTDTGGFYLPMRGAKTIDTLYQHSNGLASLPKSETTEKRVKRFHEVYHWPLALAIVLMLFEMLLPESKPETEMAKSARATLKPAIAVTAVLLLVLGLAFSAAGSPASALREYNAGKYDQSLKDYQQALEKKKDDPRLHFNAGAAAYRNRQYEQAAKHFGDALNTPDLNLQQQAFYNLGNALYYLGESNADPSQRSKHWEEAAKDFQNTMKLNPKDGDAKFNYEFVKKKIEELKQQQQQQNQQQKNDQKQDQDKNQDQQNQQNKNQENQDNKDDQSKQDQSQQKQDDKQNQQAQNQQQKDQQEKDQQQQQQQQAGKPQDQKDKEQQQASQSQPKDKSDEKSQEQQAYALGQMTPQQAQQLLDAQKGQEMMLPVKPEGKPQDRGKPLKDW